MIPVCIESGTLFPEAALGDLDASLAKDLCCPSPMALVGICGAVDDPADT
jgi:hypothetical protein